MYQPTENSPATRILEGEHIPYMALDLDPDRVRQAAAAGQSVVFGDAARLQSLMAAGLARASAVVVSYHDTASATTCHRSPFRTITPVSSSHLMSSSM